jgi:hypothetical protein
MSQGTEHTDTNRSIGLTIIEFILQSPFIHILNLELQTSKSKIRRSKFKIQRGLIFPNLRFGFWILKFRFLGNHGEGETPVPIPNTEVKPFSADGTAWVTVWESRTLPRLKFVLAKAGIQKPIRNDGLFLS